MKNTPLALVAIAAFLFATSVYADMFGSAATPNPQGAFNSSSSGSFTPNPQGAFVQPQTTQAPAPVAAAAPSSQPSSFGSSGSSGGAPFSATTGTAPMSATTGAAPFSDTSGATPGSSGGAPFSATTGTAPFQQNSSGSGNPASGGTGAGGGMGGGGGADVIFMGGVLAVTDKALTAINSDTDQILTHVAKIDANIDNMNQVMAAKQALALQVAQMDLLATQGKVIQADPLNPSASGAGVSSMDTVANALANAGQQNLGSSQAMSSFMQQSGSQGGNATPAGPGGMGTSMGNLQLNGGGNMTSVGGLQSMGTAMLTQALSQIGSSVAGLIFNGFNSAMSFSGLNASNIDNIMGNAGQILAMDRVIPQVVVPLSGSMKSQLMPAGYTLTAEEAVNGKKLADGLYVRNETPYDAAYVSMVQKGTGADRMQFYAAIAEADIATYTPVSGNAAPGYGFRSAVNMNDALSAGAYNAVKVYNTKAGGGPNPYASFAKTVAPIIPQLALGKEPDSVFNIPQSAIDAASKAPKVNLRNRGTLAQAVGAKDMARYASAFKGFARPDACSDDYRLAQTASTDTNATVAVVTDTPQGAALYSARLKSNDTLIQQGNILLAMDRLMLQYSKNTLKASADYRNALQKVSTSMTAQNAIESVAPMIQNCDNMSVVLQRQIADYTTDIQRILKERYEAMAARDKIVSDQVAATQSSVLPTLRSAVYGTPSN